jgi:hypothetical protein
MSGTLQKMPPAIETWIARKSEELKATTFAAHELSKIAEYLKSGYLTAFAEIEALPAGVAQVACVLCRQDAPNSNPNALTLVTLQHRSMRVAPEWFSYSEQARKLVAVYREAIQLPPL